MDWNLATVWESVADAMPEHTVIVHGENRRTWRELDSRASRVAGALRAAGLGTDAKVAQFLYNGNEYLEILYGAFKARAVPVNVNYRYLEDELAYLLDNSDAEALFFHGSLGDRVAKVLHRSPGVKLLVQIDDGSPHLEQAVRYEDLLASAEPMERVNRSGDDLYFLYTGGTTGMPKAVMWRNEDLFGVLGEGGYPLLGGTMPERSEGAGAVAASIVESGRRIVHLPASPLMHGTGAFTSFQAMFGGGTIVTLTSRHFDPHELWRVVAEEGVTQMAIVGDAFAKPMLRALEEGEARGHPYDLSTVQLIISSGVMWTAEVKEGLCTRGNLICLDSLGSSEGVGFAASMSASGAAARTASFSIGPSAKVLRDDGEEVVPGSGEIGMLAVGGYIPSGYYKDASGSDATFRVLAGRRWSIPGDYASVGADGTVTLLGRGSVCINSGGEKIYPEEVEEAIKQHPAVADCLVVGVPDDRFGEAVTAVVALHEGEATDEAALALSVEHLARYKRPRHVVFVPLLERGPNGKADYRWAKATAAEALTTS